MPGKSKSVTGTDQRIKNRKGVHRSKRTLLMGVCVLLFFVAVILRLGFVKEVLGQYATLSNRMKASGRFGFLAPDSSTYLNLADNFTSGELLHVGTISRPPGYPAFLWVCGRSPSHILIVQAILCALIPVCAFLFSYHLLGNFPISTAAGLVSAVSPTGIGVSGLVLADSLLAVLFAVGLLVLLYGAKRRNIIWVLASAVLFGAGGIVKPLLLFWPVLSAVVWWLFRRGEMQRVEWTRIGALFLVQGLFLTGLATCNYVRDTVFTVSEIGPRTVREYWAVRVEEWARAGHKPGIESIKRNQDATRKRLDEKPPVERIRVYKEESRRIFRSHPVLAAIVFLRNIHELSIQGWDRFYRQAPLDPFYLGWLRKMSGMEAIARRFSRWLTIPALLIALMVSRFRRVPENRRICLMICGLWVAYMYVTLCSGVTFWTGTRIVYPIEVVTITIVAAEVDLLYRAVKSKVLKAG